jgi:hypothetical protein
VEVNGASWMPRRRKRRGVGGGNGGNGGDVTVTDGTLVGRGGANGAVSVAATKEMAVRPPLQADWLALRAARMQQALAAATVATAVRLPSRMAP